VLAIGMSPFLMNLTACFIVILINKGLKTYGGDLMIGAYGIVNRLAFIFVMIVMGINQGMQPIAGYNFGAQQYDRVLKVLRLTIVCAVCVTSSGFVVGGFMPHLAVSAGPTGAWRTTRPSRRPNRYGPRRRGAGTAGPAAGRPTSC